MDELKNKYIALLKAEFQSSILPGSTDKTQCLRGLQRFTDSKPIVFFNNMPLAQRYKKAKISKAKSGWYVWFEYRNPNTGEFEQFTRKHGINRIKGINEKKKEAQALVLAINEQLAEGWNPYGYTGVSDELRDKTLIECMHHLLKYREHLREGSYKKYKDVVTLFERCLEISGNKYIFPQVFNETHAISFGDYMTYILKHAGKTHNGHKGNLSWFFGRLKAKKIITDNPIAAIPKRTENAAVRIAFTDAERKLLKADFAANNPLLGEFCQHMYFLGLRPKELLMVQLRDVFIDERKIMIYTGTSKNRRQEPVYMSRGNDGND